MNKYINANHLIQDIERSRANNQHNNSIASQTHNAEHRHFIKMVLDQPVVDVVEVVRCKECKYLEIDEGWQGGRACLMRGGDTGWCHDTDFCSYGERKDK